MGLNLLDYPSVITHESIQFLIPDKKEAWLLLEQQFYELASITQNGGFKFTTLRYPNSKNPLKVTARQAKEYLKMPQGLNFGNCEIPYELLRYVYRMGESEASQGLVKISGDDGGGRQIILSANSRLFTPDFKEVMKKTRADYWFAPDLHEFDLRWRQELRTDGSNWITQTYRVFNHNDPSDRNGWKEFTSRYCLLVDDNGNAYQIGENLNVREIAAPV